MERLPGGFYRAHGRVDDTMNLGGIKVSSVEIERVCNAADPSILETAAIGIPPPGKNHVLVQISVNSSDHVFMHRNAISSLFLYFRQMMSFFETSRVGIPPLTRIP